MRILITWLILLMPLLLFFAMRPKPDIVKPQTHAVDSVQKELLLKKECCDNAFHLQKKTIR